MTHSSPPSKPRSAMPGIVVAIVGLSVLAFGGYALWQMRPELAAQQQVSVAPVGCIDGDLSAFGGPIELVETGGATVTEADFRGRPAVIYFGFTYCPDVCPLSMYALGAAMEQLGPQAGEVRTALISVDPARDTPEIMGQYVSTQGFPVGLRGLTGSPAQVDAARRAFRVIADRVDQPNSSADYLINHTSFAYILDADWTVKGVISTTEADPATIAACIRHTLKL